jgi:hypothetical protein
MQILSPHSSKDSLYERRNPAGNVSNHVVAANDAANFVGWKSWRNLSSWYIL